ncbi:MAG TPA: nucleoside hydrolase [Edaphobacter sp.]|nr:nucleoside hydrolase [Edaphobacter sp.]
MKRKRCGVALLLAVALNLSSLVSRAQTAAAPAKVILDTDIGDDVDDVFALGLALTSPELKILGITSAWGDTALRSRMIDRLLCETGRSDIPVRTGIATKTNSSFTQKAWVSQGIEREHSDAVSFLLEQIKLNPGEITLIAVGPLTNIGAAIDRDPETFRKLKRVVLMGGSIYRGYGDLGYTPHREPIAEYNIMMDIPSAQKLFQSGVPIFMMPLDSTQIKFDEVKRSMLASISTPLTDTLQILSAEWSLSTQQTTPTLFDAVAAAYAIKPGVCPTTPLRIVVDKDGFTRVQPGTPNANVCLEAQTDVFFKLLMPRLMNQNLAGNQVCIAPKK